MPTDLLTSTFIRLQSRLKATARQLLNSDIEADDALQDAFYRLWQHRHDVTTTPQAEGLSVTAVRNICLDTLRRRKRDANVPLDQANIETSESYEDINEQTELYESVKRIIDRNLSEREKNVITMRDTAGMDFADIAEELGISENNVRMILSRARKNVRNIYLSSPKD